MVRTFFITLILAAAVNAQGVKVKAEAYTDTTDYLLGDYINFTIKITAPQNIQIGYIPVKDSLSNVEMVSEDEPVKKEEGENNLYLFNYILSRYDSASVEINPLPVYYREGSSSEKPFILEKRIDTDTSFSVAYTNPVSFKIHKVSVMQNEDIKDIKAPQTIPLDWKTVLMYILIILLAAGVLIYIYVKYIRKRPRAVKPVKILPPHVTALNALNELEQKELWQKGLIKEYHSQITGIIRSYFEKRFNFPALELTTGEAVARLKEINGTKEIVPLTYQFLSNADLVKFAKFTPMDEVNKEMMRQAYEIVDNTKPAETSAAAEVKNV